MKIRLKISLAIAAMAAMLVPGVAMAHVTVSPEEAPSEGYAMLTFTVPHGCDGAATNKVSIQMPDQVISATPGVVAGWSIQTKEGKLPKPAEQHGETITEGVRQVTWSGGPLADGQLEQFPLSVALSGAEGEVAEFKVVQDCVGGDEIAWIQSTPASGEEPEYPAPMLTLGAAEDHHGSSAKDGEGEEMVHSEQASSTSEEDDSDDALVIVALVIGALGLLTGGIALVTARRAGK